MKSENDIIKVEVGLVNRVKVNKWIRHFNLDIPAICERMRRTHQRRLEVRNKQGEKIMWFVLSEHLAEKPIVLVIPKDIYIGMCDWWGFVTKDGIERMHGDL